LMSCLAPEQILRGLKWGSWCLGSLPVENMKEQELAQECN